MESCSNSYSRWCMSYYQSFDLPRCFSNLDVFTNLNILGGVLPVTYWLVYVKFWISSFFLQTFADWGIDMIKLDGCNSCTNLFKAGHEAFAFYINQTGREMYYSCEWPCYLPEDKPKVQYPEIQCIS